MCEHRNTSWTRALKFLPPLVKTAVALLVQRHLTAGYQLPCLAVQQLMEKLRRPGSQAFPRQKSPYLDEFRKRLSSGSREVVAAVERPFCSLSWRTVLRPARRELPQTTALEGGGAENDGPSKLQGMKEIAGHEIDGPTCRA